MLFADDIPSIGLVSGDSVENTGQEVDENEAIFSSMLFYVSVGVISAVFIIVVVVAVGCYLLICNKRRRDHVVHSRFTHNYYLF